MKYLTRSYSNNHRGLWEDFENFFNASPFFNSSYPVFKSESGSYQPAVDLYEDDAKYFVRAEIPGFKKKEIKVEFEGGRLQLKGERKEKGESGERAVSFQRSVRLPSSIEATSIGAKYENGLLTITIPKAEAAKPRQIEIKN